jgi:hypothetical protein
MPLRLHNSMNVWTFLKASFLQKKTNIYYLKSSHWNIWYFAIKSIWSLPDKPIIDTSPSIAKSASDKGKTGVLTCKAKGAPDVSFNWSRKGAVINVEKSDGKYEVTSKMVDR